MNKSLMNLVLRLPEEDLATLQDEAEEFSSNRLDEYVSLILSAVVRGHLGEVSLGSIYERIDWKAMKKEGLL